MSICRARFTGAGGRKRMKGIENFPIPFKKIKKTLKKSKNPLTIHVLTYIIIDERTRGNKKNKKEDRT